MNREGALSIQRQSQLRQALLPGLATAFAAVTILYSALWMYAVRRPSALVELGFNKTRSVQYKGKIHGIPVLDVVPGSPAERAGLRPDDLIVGINGQTLQTSAPLDETWARSRPGDQVEVTVERQGDRSEEHTSELQSRLHLVCRLLLEKKKKKKRPKINNTESQTIDVYDKQ